MSNIYATLLFALNREMITTLDCGYDTQDQQIRLHGLIRGITAENVTVHNPTKGQDYTVSLSAVVQVVFYF
jgi:hypothetical protein